jgi:hypothetical protein
MSLLEIKNATKTQRYEEKNRKIYLNNLMSSSLRDKIEF